MLLLLLGVTVVDVGGREVFGHPLPGGYEISELVMLALFFLALPFVSFRGEHITVTLVDRWISKSWRLVLSAAGNGLLAAILLGLAPWIWRQAASAAGYGDLTLYLQLPVSPFLYMAAVLTVVSASLAGVRACGDIAAIRRSGRAGS